MDDEIIEPSSLCDNVSLVCVLFLDRQNDVETRSLFARIVDGLVRYLQPSPVMLHCELLMISGGGEYSGFATYIGDEAGWRLPSDEYYLSHTWRAIPVDGGVAVDRLSKECDSSRGTPYSLVRYALSTRAFGWLSYLLGDRLGTPAHCAGLTARLLRHGLVDKNVDTELQETRRGAALLPLPSCRYSPSLLYHDLCENAAYADFDIDEPSFGDPTVQAAVDILHRGSDDEVERMDWRLCATAVKAVAVRLHSGLVEEGVRTRAEDTHTLAWIALRAAKRSLRTGTKRAETPPSVVVRLDSFDGYNESEGADGTDRV